MKSVKNFDLKNFNTFRISSIADIAYFPANLDEFTELLKTLENPFILGGGSNILLSSSGIEAPVILTHDINKMEFEKNILTLEAGVKTPLAARFALENSFSGFEFLIAIPGSIGGAVTMNASAHSQAISDTFMSAKLFDMQSKNVVEFSHKEMDFGYRTSALKGGKYLFLEGKFLLSSLSKNKIKQKMDANLEYRTKHQPSLKTPNAGSIFKNPAGTSAGKLIQDCGLKGTKIGGAEISTLHGNFIINNGSAKSTDIARLMLLAYNEVKSQTNIELEPEIIFAGRKSDLEEEIWKKM